MDNIFAVVASGWVIWVKLGIFLLLLPRNYAASTSVDVHSKGKDTNQLLKDFEEMVQEVDKKGLPISRKLLRRAMSFNKIGTNHDMGRQTLEMLHLISYVIDNLHHWPSYG